MTQPTLVFLDASTLTRGDLDLGILNRLGRVVLHPLSSRDEILRRVAEADIVITNKAVMDGSVMDRAPRLRFIAVSATGTNNVDLPEAKKRGIKVSNVAGYSTESVAQHAMAFILNWATQMHIWAREAEKWPASPIFTRLDHPVVELAGRSLGLVGAGKIGTRLGRLAEAFGMTIRAWERDSKAPHSGPWPRLPLKELFEQSDVISLHCPLTEQTRRLINAESLGWMRPGAFLVNTGRGDLVDENALKEALLSGRLGGAGLDVLSQEPPPPGHPLLNPGLPNLLITPHTAWTSREARGRLLSEVAANIEAFLRGEDRNRVA